MADTGADFYDPNAPTYDAQGGEDSKADRYLKQLGQLKSDRSLFDEQFEEVATWIIPKKAGFQTKFSKGAKTNLEIFDSTAPRANHKLAAAVHGALTTTAMEWFGLRFRSDDMNKIVAARGWLDGCTQRMHQALAESNFDAEAVEAYEDLFGFGTFAVLHELKEPREAKAPGFPGFRFRAIPLSDVWIAERPDGRVNTIYIELPLSAEAIVRQFGIEKVGEKVRNVYAKKPHEIMRVVLAIKPSYDARRIPPGQIAPPSQRPYQACYIEPKSKRILKEDGYYEFPVHVARVGKKSGEMWGRGIGLQVLPDVKTLNKAKELGLKAWEKVLDPPMKRRHKGTMSAVKAFAGGITDVRRMEDLEPLYDSNAFRFDVSELKHRDLQSAIEQAYFIDQLQLPPVQDSKTMSATEIEVRFEQMQRLLGPSLGRIVNEFMNPLVERCFNCMFREGALPLPPAMLYESEDSNIDIEYVGPFARAQKMANVTAIQRWLADMGPYAELDPTIFDGVDWDSLREELADRYGVPARVQKSREQVAKERQARAEQQARQQELLEAGAQSEIAKNVQGA